MVTIEFGEDLFFSFGQIWYWYRRRFSVMNASVRQQYFFFVPSYLSATSYMLTFTAEQCC